MQANNTESTKKIIIPDDYLCSLTGELMADPVIVTTESNDNGAVMRHQHRFERMAIIIALHDKNLKLCPLNNLPLVDQLNILPLDNVLQAEIAQFIAQHPEAGQEKFDPMAYLLAIKITMKEALSFLFQHAQDYVVQFIDTYRDQLINCLNVNDDLFYMVIATGPDWVPNLLNLLSDEQVFQLIRRSDNEGRNMLMLACRCAPPAVVPLLARLQNEQVAATVVQVGNDGCNALMLACRYAPAAVVPLLARLQNEQVAVAVEQVSIHGYNGLMNACRYAPAEVVPLLARLENEQVAVAVEQVSIHGDNALILACQYAPNASVPLLAKLSKEQVAAAVAQVGNGGYNALMIACRCAPDAVVPLLARLRNEQVAAAVAQVGNEGYNALMLACSYAPAAVAPLLARLSSEQVAAAMAQVSNKGTNAQAIFSKYNAAASFPYNIQIAASPLGENLNALGQEAAQLNTPPATISFFSPSAEPKAEKSKAETQDENVSDQEDEGEVIQKNYYKQSS